MGLRNTQDKLKNERYATSKNRSEKMQYMQKKYLVLPGPPGPPGQKVLGPVVLAGQDLETLKVPWSCQDRT